MQPKSSPSRRSTNKCTSVPESAIGRKASSHAGDRLPACSSSPGRDMVDQTPRSISRRASIFSHGSGVCSVGNKLPKLPRCASPLFMFSQATRSPGRRRPIPLRRAEMQLNETGGCITSTADGTYSRSHSTISVHDSCTEATNAIPHSRIQAHVGQTDGLRPRKEPSPDRSSTSWPGQLSPCPDSRHLTNGTHFADVLPNAGARGQAMRRWNHDGRPTDHGRPWLQSFSASRALRSTGLVRLGRLTRHGAPDKARGQLLSDVLAFRAKGRADTS
ncbi:hypothetical protein EV651_12863 [Kribbella sp. VKM Ac-2571]|nr:hypothetical protein EV651_12863 [Kribbella sp. VKM Ac-2571]